jgi:hypothetical protein
LNTLLILKLTVAPVLVACMSLIARRFGPTIGGLIMGLPWMTGPVLFLLAVEKGDVYLTDAARGALLAVPPIGAFGLAYALVSMYARWPLSLGAAALAFVGSGALLSGLGVSPSMAAVLGVLALIAAHVLIVRPHAVPVIAGLPWWDIPARMIATAVLVAGVALGSERLGPVLSGIASSYPVVMTVVITATHARWGRSAAVTMLRAVMLSLIGFVAFFLVVAEFAVTFGHVRVYVAACLAGVSVSALLLMRNGWLVRRAASAQ